VPPAIIAAVITAATAATGFGLQASGALTPGAPHAPAALAKPPSPALTTAQIASAASPYAAEAQSQVGGGLSPEALMQMIRSLMQQGGQFPGGGADWEAGLRQAVNQSFGPSFQPGLTTTGFNLT
jgi:hypothetical protein